MRQSVHVGDSRENVQRRLKSDKFHCVSAHGIGPTPFASLQLGEKNVDHYQVYPGHCYVHSIVISTVGVRNAFTADNAR